MNFYDRGGSRGHRHARVPARPQDQAAAFRLALEWREAWRAEKEKAAADAVGTEKPGSQEEEKRRARFAAAIARAELGRAYWDERRHRGGKESAPRPTGAKHKGSGG